MTKVYERALLIMLREVTRRVLVYERYIILLKKKIERLEKSS